MLASSGLEHEVIDAGGAPDIAAGDYIRAGITTTVEVLGSDRITRSLGDLALKLAQLESSGLTGFLITGSFHLPAVTLTGSVRGDLAFVDQVLGVKFAINEPMAADVTIDQAVAASSEALLGAGIAGKRGVVHMHVGTHTRRLDRLFELIERTGLPISKFWPTHINRSEPDILSHGIEFARQGGTVDLSASMCQRGGSLTGIAIQDAMPVLLDGGVPIERITMTSDGNVSMPVFDAAGNREERMKVVGVDYLSDEWRAWVKSSGTSLETALLPVTTNPARILGLATKGRIAPGADADLLILNDDLAPRTLIGRGRVLLRDGEQLIYGPFEAPVE